jgi:hypothetical protein
VKVFISWSGETSREVAIALRDWLPGVINRLEPFVSSKDIYAGTRWQAEIAAQLETSNFGIVCVTHDNQSAPWLNFEAGALAKVVDSSYVVPLTVDLKPSDVEMPLGQFQAQPATEEGIHELLVSINGVCQSPLAADLLEKAVRTWWPELREKLDEIKKRSAPKPGMVASRSDRELLEEMLDTTRSLARLIQVEHVPASLSRDAMRELSRELAAVLKASDQHDWRIENRGGADRVTVRMKEPPTRALMRDLRDSAAPRGIDIHFASLEEDDEEDVSSES